MLILKHKFAIKKALLLAACRLKSCNNNNKKIQNKIFKDQIWIFVKILAPNASPKTKVKKTRETTALEIFASWEDGTDEKNEVDALSGRVWSRSVQRFWSWLLTLYNDCQFAKPKLESFSLFYADVIDLKFARKNSSNEDSNNCFNLSWTR